MSTQTVSYRDEGEGRYRRLRPGPGLSRDTVAADQQLRLRRAVVDIVGTHGYEALTVRRLTKQARVSRGALYSHFRSTDDCFLSTFDRVCGQVAERMLSACRGELMPRRRLALAIDRLFKDMVAAPRAAGFMLWAAPAAGPAFADRLWSSAMRLGSALEACLHSGNAPQVPPAVLEGIVAGVARIGRTRVPSLAEQQTGELAAETAEWIASLGVPAAKDENQPNGSLQIDIGSKPPADERAMILAAAFRISKGGYHQLSVPRICREAGVPRRDFNRLFESHEECLLAALEERVSAAAEAVRRVSPASADWNEALGLALVALCDAVENDVDGSRLLFVDVAAAGTAGIRCRDRQISQIAAALRSLDPGNGTASDLAIEASTAAAWAALQRWVPKPGLPAPPPPLATLRLLMLAPLASERS